MRIDIISIFPQYLEPLNLSLIGKAQSSGRVDIAVHDLRAQTTDRHNTVDDSPYGGGPGMVMLAQPWLDALENVVEQGPKISTRPRLVVPTPSGRVFTQAIAGELAQEEHLIFACGRYEGIDERFFQQAEQGGQGVNANVNINVDVDVDRISIGDFVLAGGEVAALVIIEALTRVIPGVLGNDESVTDDSFAPGAMQYLVEGPIYTKPATWQGHDVPEVLVSGDHAAIARWRRDQSLLRTIAVRPDLIQGSSAEQFDDHDLQVLASAGWTFSQGRWVH